MQDGFSFAMLDAPAEMMMTVLQGSQAMVAKEGREDEAGAAGAR